MKSTIKIRKVEKNDLIHIFQIEEETFSPMHYPLFVLRQFFDISPDLFFVAVDDLNQIGGYCFGGVDRENNIGWVLTLAVTKPYQRMKIGQRLTTQLLSAFKNIKVNAIHLTTTPDNTAAIKLYEKLGFEKMKEETNYYLDSSPRIVMKIQID